MSKKNKSCLGRSLIKDRFAKKGRPKSNDLLHTSELNDGFDWGRLNLQSVTEESSFQEFLSTADLAGTEFQSERMNLKVVTNDRTAFVLSADQRKKFNSDCEEKRKFLKIPRRPPWNENMTGEELQALERDSFLNWRRDLVSLEEEEGVVLTPFEKNLNFWRQLWRVIEKSDVVIQILDARNPLLFRCEDLESYVKEVNPLKVNMLLLNKSDFLTHEQRIAWARYFDSARVKCIFFSAISDSEELENGEESHNRPEENNKQQPLPEDPPSETNTDLDLSSISLDSWKSNSPELLSRDQVLSLLDNILDSDSPRVMEGVTTIGLVGYPNVGKSSTINSLLACKKTSVSATPGKTKHFQTLFLTKEILLCDCPGLVMPCFVATKADMVLNGILPVDQLRDHVPSISLLLSLFPRKALESHYGIIVPRPKEGEDPHRPPTPEEFLNSYAYSRGFMTQNGQPDNPRAARYILKDFVQGKLLHCVAPPHVDQETYHQFKGKDKQPAEPTPSAMRAIQVHSVTSEDLEKSFFSTKSLGAHVKGRQDGRSQDCDVKNPKKPWKDHSQKRNKKEKLRRVYRYLDE